MSYQLIPPRLIRRSVRRAGPSPLVPLGQPPMLPVPQPKEPMKMFLIGMVVVALLMVLLWWANEKSEKPVEKNRSRASKQSTKEMANNLYRRLDKRGGANPATIRSLKALGRK